MLIRRQTIKKLSSEIRKIIDGQIIDLRDNREGVWSALRNDIHTLAYINNEQMDVLQFERDLMKDTIANISHQLKTPLTSVMMMVDLLDSMLATNKMAEDKQDEFLTNLKMSLTQMDWLVSALLKMARLDAGVIMFSKNQIQACTLISLALEPLQIMLDIKNQSVDILGEAKFNCDKNWTVEALVNVLKNASEYSPVGGKIFIEVGKNPLCKWISITDSGTGITNAEIARIFKRFEGSRNNMGYGIGLPLALAIMRGQNGDIEVSKGANGGAVFTLKFY